MTELSTFVCQDIQLMSLSQDSGVECASNQLSASPLLFNCDTDESDTSLTSVKMTDNNLDKDKIVKERRHAAGTDTNDAVPCTPSSSRQRQAVPNNSSSSQAAVHRSSTEPIRLVEDITTDANLAVATSALDLRKSELCDVFMICCYEDEDNARKVVQILEKFLWLSDGRNPRFFREIDIGEDIFDYLEDGLAHSRFRFIFLDKNSSDDGFDKFKMHRALYDMILRKDRSIVPVKAYREVFTPHLLGMFRALEIERLLRCRPLDGIDDVSELTDSDIDPSLLASIAKIIDPASTFQPKLQTSSSKSDLRKLIRKNYNDIVERLDPDSGLLGNLFSDEVLTRREMETVKAEKTYFDRNECLLKILLRKGDKNLDKFKAALQKSDQSHITELLDSAN